MALPVKQEGLFVFDTAVFPAPLAFPLSASQHLYCPPALLYIQVIWINHYFNLPEI